MLAGIYAFRFQIAENLTQHIFVTGFVEIRDDDFLRIGSSGGAIQAELISRPFPEQLIASRLNLKIKLLIAAMFLLETFLALVELAHLA